MPPIDSAEKRRNISGLIAAISVVGVTPNSAKDQEWRQQAGWGYSGILAGEPPVPPPPPPDLTVWYEAARNESHWLRTRHRDISSTGDSLIS